jgi:primosomal protein N' (replication factor Y)
MSAESPTKLELIAEVAVSRPVGRLLDYIVPPNIKASVGSRALIPLGNGRATGLIMALHKKVPNVGSKSIFELLDDEPALDVQLVATLRFTMAWYRAEPCDVVRAALPAGLGVETVKTLLRQTERPLPFDLVHLESEFSRDGSLAAKKLDSRSLARLMRCGAVQAAVEVKKAKPEPQTEWLRAILHPDEFPGRAKSQLGLLSELYSIGSWQPLSALQKRKGMRRLIRELCAKKAIETQRRSWADTDLQKRDKAPTLNDEQQQVVEAICATPGFAQHLVFGITGSGKTEVYLQAIERLLSAGKQALVLVPEIALTPQMVQRFAARFGDAIAVLHSALAPGARRAAWHRARRGEAAVVIGARSAVFASMPHLGLIVVDEEHDSSYKQSDGLRYQARDLAIYRAQKEAIPVVLGSATPSLESYHRSMTGEHNTQLHRLKTRATGAELPPVQIVDLRGAGADQYPLSNTLCKLIEETLARKEQVMLLLNRRGWAPALLCLDCGHRNGCPDCSVPMVIHRGQRAVCHWCGRQSRPPERCPDCGSSALIDAGIGTQQLEAACIERFPDARVARLDSDTARSTRRLEATLKAMAEGETDLLVGTQMLAKGHDLEGVTLVGVICADQGLRMPDPRCAERCFSLLTQVAGRAGRGGRPGRVLFQTFDPDHLAIRCASKHDAEGFYKLEMQRRKNLALPPFSRAAMLRCSHPDPSQCERAAADLAAVRHPNVDVFGPIPAVIEKLRGRYRFQVMATSKTASSLQAWLTAMAPTRAAWIKMGVRVAIDVDPSELL